MPGRSFKFKPTNLPLLDHPVYDPHGPPGLGLADHALAAALARVEGVVEAEPAYVRVCANALQSRHLADRHAPGGHAVIFTRRELYSSGHCYITSLFTFIYLRPRCCYLLREGGVVWCGVV
jgi:hypothetical protein